ncbi:MAG: acireductone synthase, partial [Bermanella sp.]
MPSFNNIQAIITDIEGTTSSISFVKDVLFPYAQKHLASFIKQNLGNAEVRAQLRAVAETCNIPIQDTKQIIQQLLNWIKDDVKATPLKNLQGMIWKKGYQNGDYKAHILPCKSPA